MANPRGIGISQLALRLTLAFVGVALAAILLMSFLSALSTGTDFTRFVVHQERNLARAVAAASGAAYHRGWPPHTLRPALLLATDEGAAAMVTDKNGNLIAQTPEFAGFPVNPHQSKAIVVNGHQVGTVTVRFDHRGLAADIGRFEAETWRARLGAAGIAAVLALVVGLAVSSRITYPVDRLIAAERAMEAGDSNARVGEVRGFGEIRELSEGFDKMADSLGEQARVRRNLVADIAHGLRTPIAILRAGHEAMLDGVSEPTRENLGSMHDEVLRLGQMVDDLQRLASAEAAALQLNLVPVDLSAIIAHVADGLSDSYEMERISLVRLLEGVEVCCDRRQLQEVVRNLLTNAMKYTPAGGTVLLETSPVGSGLARIRVSDTGIGIPGDELPHVTERFFRGQQFADLATGSGIGLTIVNELVRAHHGELEIASTPGKGTQVTITLPRSAGAIRQRDHAD
jgi:two-component system sensor histidine kinase BaeS